LLGGRKPGKQATAQEYSQGSKCGFRHTDYCPIVQGGAQMTV